jgi:peptide/nickel transport system substrate-binding protein
MSISRRRFLGAIGVASAGALIAACASPPAPTATPAAAPKPAEPAKAAAPEAPKPAAAEPTKPAAAAPAAAPAATKPAEVAKPAEAPKPAAPAAAPAAAKPGAVGLPVVITDAAMTPKAFKQSPATPANLPPVEQRIPSEPLVLKPAGEIGKFGGTWRMGFTGPGDGQNMDRHVHDHLIYWDAKVEQLVPHVAKGWEVQDGGKTFVFHLRKGHKWSDGKPFTADDIMFWYEDLYMNEDLNPTRASFMAINGKQGKVEKLSETSVAFKFDAPYYMFLDQVASLGVAGHFNRGKEAMGLYAPKHYSSQFHPKYADKAKIEAAAKDAKFDNWATYFKNRNDPKTNMDCPTLAPWKPTSAITTPSMSAERNPYYFVVDTDGNQLPYIDKITWTLAENLEVLNLRAVAGEYDLQVRHIDIAKLPAFKQNEQKGNYSVKFWNWPHGTDAGFFINQNWDADPEVAKWLRSKEFRQALSYGIDRKQLNEVFWLGQGEPGGPAPASNSLFSPGPEFRTLHSTLDAKKANDMLDKLGLDKKDASGMRLRTDGKGPLVLEVATVGAAFVNWTGISEMVAQHWAKNIGIKANVTQLERTLMERRRDANELQLRVWSNDGSDNPFTYPDHLLAYNTGSAIAPRSGVWYQSGGTQGTKPEGDLLKMTELYDKGKGVPAEERVALGKEIHKISAENVWVIGTVGNSPALLGVVIQSNKMGNVPDSIPGSTPGQTPGHARPTQFYFKG